MRQKWCTSQTSVVVLFCFLIICFWAKRRNLWRPTHLWNQFQVATPGTAAFGTSAVTLGWSYNLTCSSEGRQFYLIIQSQSALFNNLCKKLALLKPSSGTPVHFADVWQWEDSSNFWRFLHTTKQNLNCSASATFLTARSVLVKRSLRLSLQISCETGEAISISKTSLQVWGLLQSSLRFGVSWGVWRASKVSSSPPLTTSLSLCAGQSVDHLGEMEEEDRVPIQLTLSARQCIFLPSVCAKDRASNRAILERQKHT